MSAAWVTNYTMQLHARAPAGVLRAVDHVHPSFFAGTV